MTTHFQPGQHPDADQLNAFVEHALPLHKQQATFAHLATCSDCRAIVYLAQSAIPEVPAHPRPVPAHLPLFSRWMLAFPAAAALTCLIFLTIHFRNTTISTNPVAAVDPRLLKPTPPPPPQAPPAEPSTPPKPAPVQIKKPQPIPVPAPRASGAAPLASPASPHKVPPQESFGFAEPPKPEMAAAARAPMDKKAVAGAMSDTGYVSTAPAPSAASTGSPLTPAASPQTPLIAGNGGRREAESRRELRSAANQYDLPHAQAQQAQASAPTAPPPPFASQNSGIYGGTGQANLNQNYATTVTVSAAPTVTTDASADSTTSTDELSLSITTASALQAKRRLTLPSKLAALSVATNARRALAVDTAGALFRSEDAGVTWQPVPIQWTGRAIKVILTASQSEHRLEKSSGSFSAPPIPAKPSAAPSAIFELTTDAGDLWISADGQTWKHK